MNTLPLHKVSLNFKIILYNKEDQYYYLTQDYYIRGTYENIDTWFRSNHGMVTGKYGNVILKRGKMNDDETIVETMVVIKQVDETTYKDLNEDLTSRYEKE